MKGQEREKILTGSEIRGVIVNIELTENPTRNKIIMTLKKKGEMTVDDLSEIIKITPMGVRQHLLILERKGLVEYVTKKQGVGRPGFIYKLTESAENLFPKNYENLALDILMDIEEREGREKIMEIFRRRKKKLFNERIGILSEKVGLMGKIKTLAEIMDKDGGMIEIDENERYYKLMQYNCPLHKVAKRYREACINDYELLRDLIGLKDIIHQERISEGARACVYLIPKA